MDRSTLYLYTDASVRGPHQLRFYADQPPEIERARYGPAIAAWIGWHDTAFAERPALAGTAFVGNQDGTQCAEYQAASLGLHAAIAYANSTRRRLDVVVLHVDNQTVANQLNGRWAVKQMRRQYETARKAIDRLEHVDIDVFVEKVTEQTEGHKVAHRMSRNAWNQVLVETSWRPPTQPPKGWRKQDLAQKSATSTEDDIPF